jgi:KTSC domain
MAWRALQSKHLNGAAYDPDRQSLTIQFVNGAVYNYGSVPPTVADTLFQAGSPGSYFHDKIKGRYPETKLADGATKKGRRSRSARW